MIKFTGALLIILFSYQLSCSQVTRYVQLSQTFGAALNNVCWNSALQINPGKHLGVFGEYSLGLGDKNLINSSLINCGLVGIIMPRKKLNFQLGPMLTYYSLKNSVQIKDLDYSYGKSNPYTISELEGITLGLKIKMIWKWSHSIGFILEGGDFDLLNEIKKNGFYDPSDITKKSALPTQFISGGLIFFLFRTNKL